MGFLKRPKADSEVNIEYDEEGKPIVYKKRWYILAAYCLCYFFWNFQGYRVTPLTGEYALYFDTTNEAQPPPEFGVDFLVLTSNFMLLFAYPIGGNLVDNYGLQMLKFGAVGQAGAAWWWYFSFTNFNLVLASKLLSSFSGALTATCLLRISSQWFPVGQRALAVAVGTGSVTFGAGLGLVVFPFFAGEDYIDFRLQSCKSSFQEDFLEDLNNSITANNVYLEEYECNDDAEEDFCCAAEVDIEFINLFLAIMGTMIAVFVLIVVEDSPPSAPSTSGNVKEGGTVWESLKLTFNRDKRHYMQVCLADFLSSGPPIVLFSTISRVFPPRISDYAFLIAAIALVLGIPAVLTFSHYLGRTKKYYEYTSRGYLVGFLAWATTTVAVAIDHPIADAVVLVMAMVAILAYTLWSVSVYELKIEYVFSHLRSLEGFVISVDRVIINLASLVFLAAIPPERYNGPVLSGRMFTFVVGAISMGAGAFLVYTIPNKRRYLRLEHENAKLKLLEDEKAAGVKEDSDVTGYAKVEEVTEPEKKATL